VLEKGKGSGWGLSIEKSFIRVGKHAREHELSLASPATKPPAKDGQPIF